MEMGKTRKIKPGRANRTRHTPAPFIFKKHKLPERPLDRIQVDSTGTSPQGGRRQVTGIRYPVYPNTRVPRGKVVSDPLGNYTYTAGYNCVTTDETTSRIAPVTRVKTVSSTGTPNFKKIKRRDLPFNPYSMTYEAVATLPGEWSAGNLGYPCREKYFGYIYNRVPHSGKGVWPTFTDSTKKSAETKAMLRVKNMKINLAQAFGERKQTAHLLQTSINRLATVALAIRNGKLGHAARVMGLGSKGGKIIGRNRSYPEFIGAQKDNLANIWLEFTYGWKPLLADIYGATEHLAYLYNARRALRASARESQSQYKLGFLKGTASGPYSGLNVWGEFSDSVFESRSKVILEFTEDDTWLDSLSRTGITNPALLTWELLPYSFVVDWLIPVGDYLSCIDAGSGLRFKRGMCYTVTKQFDVTYWKELSHAPPNTGFDQSASMKGNTQTRRKEQKTRVIYNSFPMPSFPSFQPKLGIEKAVTSLSLLNQLFRGRTSVR